MDILSCIGTGEIVRISTFESNGYLNYFATVKIRLAGWKVGSSFDNYMTLVGNAYQLGRVQPGARVQFTGTPAAKKNRVRPDGAMPAYGEVMIRLDSLKVLDEASASGEPTGGQQAPGSEHADGYGPSGEVPF